MERSVPFVLSKTTEAEFDAALAQVAKLKAEGFKVKDVKKRPPEKNGEVFGVIVMKG